MDIGRREKLCMVSCVSASPSFLIVDDIEPQCRNYPLQITTLRTSKAGRIVLQCANEKKAHEIEEIMSLQRSLNS